MYLFHTSNAYSCIHLFLCVPDGGKYSIKFLLLSSILTIYNVNFSHICLLLHSIIPLCVRREKVSSLLFYINNIQSIRCSTLLDVCIYSNENKKYYVITARLKLFHFLIFFYFKLIFLNLLSIWEVIENSLKSICKMAKKFIRKYKYKYKYAQFFLG